jgi:hypothetical protein
VDGADRGPLLKSTILGRDDAAENDEDVVGTLSLERLD